MVAMVKVLLATHRYPPDKQPEAIEKVIAQAELLADSRGRSTRAGAAAFDPWRTFLTRERMATVPEQLATVIAGLKQFLLLLIEDVNGDWRWKPRGRLGSLIR